MDFGLYLVMTDPIVGYARCAEAAVACGVRYLQLRMKRAGRDEIVRTASAVRDITRGSETLFIVNDDPAIAREVDADGVHLGQDDMPLPEARAAWPAPGKVFGLSTHNVEQARLAERIAPDYIGIGPIYATPTKDIPDPTVGLENLRRITAAGALTTVAIGGINIANLRETLAAGATNFAVVRAVMQSPDPAAAIRELQAIWRKHTRPA
jgi:thiamine-phosphate pyrophosphorylase